MNIGIKFSESIEELRSDGMEWKCHEILVKKYQLSTIRLITSEDLIYSVVTIVNNTVLCI